MNAAKNALYIGAAVLAAALAWQFVKGGKQIVAAIPKVLAAVNPLNPENVVNKTVNTALFPSGDESLGTWLASKLSPSVRAADAAIDPNAGGAAPLILDEYLGDLPLDTSPGFVSNIGGAAVGILRKP